MKIFFGQDTSENVLFATREHWFILFGKIVAWFLFVLVLFAFDHYGRIYLPALFEGTALDYVTVIKNIYLMFLMLGLFMVITLHYLNVHVVTDKRILDIDQTGLFSQTLAEITFDSIEDVSSSVNGFFGTLLNYGTVEVQTAGEKENIVLENIPGPHAVEKLIFDQLGPGFPRPNNKQN